MTEPAPTTYFEDLSIGDHATVTRTVTERDIEMFAECTGDNNPVHLDADYAAGTMFKQRIAHGMLSAGVISAVFGTQFPGPGSIYVGQTLKFKAPVFIGAELEARVEVKELIAEKRFAVFTTTCSVDGKPVVTGEATLMIPAKPA